MKGYNFITMKQKSNRKLILFYVVFAVLAKIMPHTPSLSPLNNFYLHAGSKLTKKLATVIVLMSTFLADIILSYFNGYSVFGYWSFFTYSGFVMIALLGSKISQTASMKKLICCVISCSFIFWTWTNFGCWLLMPIYTKNLFGLINCYTKALPFLRNAVFGDLLWSIVVFNSLYRMFFKKIFFDRLQVVEQKNK